MTKGAGAGIVRRMEETGIGCEDFFTMPTPQLNERLGINSRTHFQQLDREEALARARKEIEFMTRHNVRSYFLLDDNYPILLRECPDPPVVLYQLGDTDLDAEQTLAMVGTRRCTARGVEWCSRFMEEIHSYYPDIVVFSGLAYGIDAASHSACLENNATTVAVVAHGLDTIYPAAHRDLARNIVKHGGSIVTEYPTRTSALRGNFLARNRIIAGLSELTIVVESEIKGGAMSTANYAFMCDRDVMAVPGRVGDQMSAGCNLLIRKQKAGLVGCAADVVESMNWPPMTTNIQPRQRNLFPELDGDAGAICRVLREQPEPVQVDFLHSVTRISIPTLMSALSELEFDGIVIKHPGNRFSMA